MRTLHTGDYAVALQHAQRSADASNRTWWVRVLYRDRGGLPVLFVVERYVGTTPHRYSRGSVEPVRGSLGAWEAVAYPCRKTVRVGSHIRTQRISSLLKAWRAAQDAAHALPLPIGMPEHVAESISALFTEV